MILQSFQRKSLNSALFKCPNSISTNGFFLLQSTAVLGVDFNYSFQKILFQNCFKGETVKNYQALSQTLNRKTFFNFNLFALVKYSWSNNRYFLKLEDINMGSVNSVIGIWKITHPIISFKKVQKKFDKTILFKKNQHFSRKIKNQIFLFKNKI